MIDSKFHAVQQRPEDVAQALFLFGGVAGFEVFDELGRFVGTGLARQRGQVQRLDLACRGEERRIGDGRQRFALVTVVAFPTKLPFISINACRIDVCASVGLVLPPNRDRNSARGVLLP